MVVIEELSGSDDVLPDVTNVPKAESATKTKADGQVKSDEKTEGDEHSNPKHFMVVVLGDVGRSPRMQYHALSLLQAGHKVSLVGYSGVPLVPDLETASADNVQLSVVRFTVPSPQLLKASLPIYLIWRILSLTLWLMHAMFVSVRQGLHKGEAVDCVIVQNPPAMPLLVVTYIYCFCQGILHGKRPAFVIDWHNLGFSMISSSNPIICQVARLYEKLLAPLATGHFTVTNAMKEWLIKNFHLPARSVSVLHDCPPALFRPLGPKEQHELLTRLHPKIAMACPKSWTQNLDRGKQTLLTELDSKGVAAPRRGRPALLTSSTSWTPDEDFGILLEALVILDAKIEEKQSDLKIMVIVTGKGPQKTMYEKKMSRLQMQHVAVQTVWLEPADYPKLLACADAGISLHTSTSGLDLPMKILDLFGCHVPVCASNFQCLSELVEDDENGRTFENSQELADELWYMLRPLAKEGMKQGLPPHGYGDLDRYSEALQDRPRWDANWTENAWPLLERII